ncbi:MAG TPA: YraN family protein [Flavitalea sp.]|nr:YraN family protein [Flavitalea sp.]
MALHNIRGKEGELQAATYFQRKGYVILYRNWKYLRYEVDIIAVKADTIHFIEVKTRHSAAFGYPEESVTRKKFAHIKKAAAAFLHRYPHRLRVQFDILSITKLKDEPEEFFLIEDVYV